MKAMVLREVSPIEKEPLTMTELPDPVPRPREIRIKISCCGVCHTELDEIEGRIKAKLPVVLGHEIIGRVEGLGSEVTQFNLGDRVGIAWIHSACGSCHFCRQSVCLWDDDPGLAAQRQRRSLG